jgi:5-formyltetrahydrofolate cyclo-ligase
MMNKTNNKTLLRQKCRNIRDSFGEKIIENASVNACELFSNTEAFDKADVILLYYPIKNEISPLPLIEKAQKTGKKIAFPICNIKNDTLYFRTINSINELTPSHFGIPEPLLSNEEPILTEHTVVIVPALAFSKDGHRLGYGKGYYDKFLRDFRGISVGFSYSSLVLDSLPTDKHDIPLKIIATESEVLYFD